MSTIDQSIAKMQAALLEINPLWRDILDCRRLGMSENMTANCCGCKLKTLRRHLRKLECLGFTKKKEVQA